MPKDEEEVEQSNSPKYGITDVRRWRPTGKAREFAWTRLAFLLFVFAIVTFAVYGYYYLKSPQGLIATTNIKVWIEEHSPFVLVENFLQRAQDIGKIDTDVNASSSEKGIIFKDFKMVGSEQIPQGSPAYIKYDIRIINDYLRQTPVQLLCSLKDSDSQLQLVPSPTIQMLGSRVTDNPRCLVAGELTREMDGSQEVTGSIKFPYKTENVGLNVYFVSDSVYNELNEGQDFFEAYDIPESNPIRALYNGEPIEIGIGVGGDNLQPVILQEGVSPLVGVTLKNSWDGTMTALNDLKLQLPEGVSINSDLSKNPNMLCPFETRPGQRNEYKMDSSLRNIITIEKGRAYTFECWLDAIDVLEPGTPYTKRQYKVSAEYDYQSQNRTATFLVRAL